MRYSHPAANLLGQYQTGFGRQHFFFYLAPVRPLTRGFSLCWRRGDGGPKNSSDFFTKRQSTMWYRLEHHQLGRAVMPDFDFQVEIDGDLIVVIDRVTRYYAIYTKPSDRPETLAQGGTPH